VISDRFTDSTFAFQGGGRGVSLAKLQALADWVHPNLNPDLTFLFDLPREVAAARMAGRALDRFEVGKGEFHDRVRAEYLRRADAEPHRFRVIDSARSRELIAVDVKRHVDQLISAHLSGRATGEPSGNRTGDRAVESAR
jgi:dTMP kinase